jgi:putative transposase
MDGKGRWVDNVFVERLWRSVKYECVYLQEWENVRTLRDALGQYFHLYNYERPHQALAKQTPYMVHYGKTIH